MPKWSLLFIYYGIGIAIIIICIPYQPGIYYGRINISYILQKNDHLLNTLRLKAQTKPRWYWKKPENFRYDRVVFEIEDSPITANADLIAGTWIKDNTIGKLDVPGLARMIGPPKTLSGEYRRQLQVILQNLKTLHRGTFDPPGGHFWVPPSWMSYQHVSLNLDIRLYGFLLWLSVWPVCMFFSKHPKNALMPSPIKVYLITVSIVAAVNLPLSLAAVAFSPEPIFWVIGCVYCLLNFPFSLLYLSHWDWILVPLLTMLTWGNIISGIVWYNTKPKASQNIETEDK